MHYVFIAQSLDGFIAAEDGGIEWLDTIPNPEGSDFGFSEFIAKVDALLIVKAGSDQLSLLITSVLSANIG